MPVMRSNNELLIALFRIPRHKSKLVMEIIVNSANPSIFSFPFNPFNPESDQHQNSPRSI